MNRRWVGLYPRSWRAIYGEEIEAALTETPLTISTVVDLVRGLADAWMHPSLGSPSGSYRGPSRWLWAAPVSVIAIAAVVAGFSIHSVATPPTSHGQARLRAGLDWIASDRGLSPSERALLTSSLPATVLIDPATGRILSVTAGELAGAP